MFNWQFDKPYNDLPKLPPKIDVETKAILKQCISSRVALAELNQAAELIPNQTMLINILPIMEAQASSEIENIVTTTDKLFQFINMEERADPMTKEALRYRSALFTGVHLLEKKPLCTHTAVSICSEIIGSDMNIRTTNGTALRNGQTREIIYTPPNGDETIRNKLKNWEKFIHENEYLDPLIILAIAHYQFEAIHPFEDGNGRTGRVLNSLILIEKDLLTSPILYLSRYIIQNKHEYYSHLLNVTKNQAWEEWILFMLKGIEETALWTTSKINAIRLLRKHTMEYIKEKKPQLYRYEIINLLFELPYTRITNLEQSAIVGRQTASKYLQELCAIGVLKEIQVGRDKLFLHQRLLQLLIHDTNDFELYSHV